MTATQSLRTNAPAYSQSPFSSSVRGRFSGHETFPFRYQWLYKAVRAVREDPEIFQAEDALVRLGVGKNMVKSIRHWGEVFGVLSAEPDPRGGRMPLLKVTDLGTKLFDDEGWDPYLEDPGTLWLLHWELCSRPAEATTWYWVFSHLPQPEFTKPELLTWLMTLVEEHGWSRTSDTSLSRDIDCFLGTYVPARVGRTVSIEDTLDCPLVELGLIRELAARGTYMLDRGERQTLPDLIFAYALAAYVEALPELAGTLAIDKIAFGLGGPGRVFALSEDALLQRLEKLDHATGGAFVYDDTAGLRQVLVKRKVKPFTLLARHYERNGIDTNKRGATR
ncbi:MAG: DUF4007 family protein [Planctomycetota bacterium]|nr:DUF4007 family protein [Planctomycetota bacterium]